MPSATTDSTDQSTQQLAENPTVQSVLSSSLQLIIALIQLGLQLGLYTVTMVHKLIPDGTQEPRQPSPEQRPATPPMVHLAETRPVTPPQPIPPTTPSPPSTPTSTSTLPPPYGDDSEGSEVGHNLYEAGDIVETDEHGWSPADLSMSVLDITDEEIEELGGPAGVADAPVDDSSDHGSIHSDDSSSSRWNRLSQQPKNPPLYQLLLTPALNRMEYVEDSHRGCIYRTEGQLWECMNTSDSRKWYAVVQGRVLGVFDSWYVQSLVLSSVAILISAPGSELVFALSVLMGLGYRFPFRLGMRPLPTLFMRFMLE